MAIQTIPEKLSGSQSTPQLPVLVYDDAMAAITAQQAIDAAQAAAPLSAFDADQTDDPEIEQLADHAYRITIKYGIQGIGLFISSERGNHNANAEQLRDIVWATPIARFPPDAVDFKGTILSGGERLGADIAPGTESTGKSVQLNIVEFTPAVLRMCTLWARAGMVNSLECSGYNPGELQFVTFRAQQDTATTYQCYFGWSGKPNVENQSTGDVTGISYHGHDHLYYNTRKVPDRNDVALGRVASSAHVVRPWPRDNLNLLPVTPDPIA
jgi:hypothetical protein